MNVLELVSKYGLENYDKMYYSHYDNKSMPFINLNILPYLEVATVNIDILHKTANIFLLEWSFENK